MLASLEAVDLGTSVSFADQLAERIRRNCIFLAQLDGRTYLLPRSTEPHVVEEAIFRLKTHGAPDGQDHEEHFRKALYRLWLISKHEKISDDDKEATIRVMAQKLAGYPTGLGMSALAECSIEHFFPSWAQLEKKITERGGWRTQLVFWLERALATLAKEQSL